MHDKQGAHQNHIGKNEERIHSKYEARNCDN